MGRTAYQATEPSENLLLEAKSTLYSRVVLPAVTKSEPPSGENAIPAILLSELYCVTSMDCSASSVRESMTFTYDAC